jgi:sialidase-1
MKLVSCLCLGIAVFLAQSLLRTDIEASEPQAIDVFVGGANGYHTYRIPSVICTPKGTLLAFCEGRKYSNLDQTPSNLVLKQSFDGGNTWQPLKVIVRAGAEAVMNPTAVFDRTTATVLLVYDRWPEMTPEHWPPETEDYKKRVPGLGRESVTTWVTTSNDEGTTWSAPVDITAMTKKPEWTHTLHGPGVGIQTRSGRLVIPCAKAVSSDIWWNFVIYSDDHGKTWQRSDNEVGPLVDESQVVELSDGTLLLNMRSDHKGCRLGATSNDGGRTWSDLFEIPALPETVCQGSILRYTWPDHHGKIRILFCNPGTVESRTTGTVRVSYDEGKTWPVAKVICRGDFAYSCLTAMPDGTIGCLYETADYRKICFQRFSLEWLTDGKDVWNH